MLSWSLAWPHNGAAKGSSPSTKAFSSLSLLDSEWQGEALEVRTSGMHIHMAF